jgi:hypothetical protein
MAENETYEPTDEERAQSREDADNIVSLEERVATLEASASANGLTDLMQEVADLRARVLQLEKAKKTTK